MNRQGKIVFAPGWNRAYHFTVEGLAMVEGIYKASDPMDCEAYINYGATFGSGDSRYHYGFIRPDGKYISRKLWGKAYEFRDGMAAVGRDAEMAMGFIDTTGKLVIPEQWQEPGFFSDGLLPIEYEDKNNPKRWQILDKEGNPLTTDPVMLGKPVISNGMFYFTQDGKTMFYGLDWKFRFSIPYQTVEPFHEGAAVVSHIAKVGYVYGYVDTSGRIILPVKYERTEPFRDGLGMAKDRQGKYYYVDNQGNFILKDLDYNLAFPFRDGIALVVLPQKDKFRRGFINKKGQFVIPPKFNSLNEFSEGLAAACEGEYPNKKCGYIDKSGKYVIKPLFAQTYNFNSGRAKVFINGDKGFSFIDKKGNIVFKTKDYRVKEFSGGAVKVEHSHSSYSYLDVNGNIIGDLRFESASDYFTEGFGIVMVDKHRSYNSMLMQT